jgi:hypothetical protein
VDAITTLRYLAPDAFQFRKQALSFLRFLVEQGATVLMSSEPTASVPDDDLRFMSDGILDMDVSPSTARCGGRSAWPSCAARTSRAGATRLRLTEPGDGGLPAPGSGRARAGVRPEIIPSGLPELDEMLGGGIERGTITILSGPSGVGKTTLGMQFMKEAAARGERSVVYAFEEQKDTLLHRCDEHRDPGAGDDRGGQPVGGAGGAAALLAGRVRAAGAAGGGGARRAHRHDRRHLRVPAHARRRRPGDAAARARPLPEEHGRHRPLHQRGGGITGDFRATEVGRQLPLRQPGLPPVPGDRRGAAQGDRRAEEALGDFGKTLRELEITDRGSGWARR